MAFSWQFVCFTPYLSRHIKEKGKNSASVCPQLPSLSLSLSMSENTRFTLIVSIFLTTSSIKSMLWLTFISNNVLYVCWALRKMTQADLSNNCWVSSVDQILTLYLDLLTYESITVRFCHCNIYFLPISVIYTFHKTYSRKHHQTRTCPDYTILWKYFLSNNTYCAYLHQWTLDGDPKK